MTRQGWGTCTWWKKIVILKIKFAWSVAWVLRGRIRATARRAERGKGQLPVAGRQLVPGRQTEEIRHTLIKIRKKSRPESTILPGGSRVMVQTQLSCPVQRNSQKKNLEKREFIFIVPSESKAGGLRLSAAADRSGANQRESWPRMVYQRLRLSEGKESSDTILMLSKRCWHLELYVVKIKAQREHIRRPLRFFIPKNCGKRFWYSSKRNQYVNYNGDPQKKYYAALVALIGD